MDTTTVRILRELQCQNVVVDVSEKSLLDIDSNIHYCTSIVSGLVVKIVKYTEVTNKHVLCTIGHWDPGTRKRIAERTPPLAGRWSPFPWHIAKDDENAPTFGEGTVIAMRRWDAYPQKLQCGRHCRIFTSSDSIGRNVVIGDYVNLSEGSFVGDNVTLGEGVEIRRDARVVDGCTVPPWTVVPARCCWRPEGIELNQMELLRAEVRALRQMLEMHPVFGTEVKRCADEWETTAREHIHYENKNDRFKR